MIDDGRRWLLSHPASRFDMVVMNTTWHWRANISNLLSAEFLKIVHSHLNPGGVEYYNTTWSREALATGAAEFPYALRIANFLAVSDRPLGFGREQWKTALLNYRIDGAPVLDLSNPAHQARLNELRRSLALRWSLELTQEFTQ